MGVPKRKMSKMKKRQRIAANSYEGVQANFCKNCGTYKGKQILTVEQ